MQDLSIDLQGLAASLSNLPVWTVLDLDPALCQTYLAPSTEQKQEKSSSSNTVSQVLQKPQPAISARDMPSEKRSNLTQLPSDRDQQQAREQNANEEQTAQEEPNAQEEQNAKDEADQDLSHAQPADDQTSSTAPVKTSNTVLPSQQAASNRQTPLSGQHQQHVQKSQQAKAVHDDAFDLDELLNAKPAPQTSTAIVKPSSQQEDSLEDWLNNL